MEASLVHAEMVEKELDAFIERRSRKGETTADDEHELWKVSTQRERERRREENRWAWVRHFDLMAANHAKLASEYERRASELCENGGASEAMEGDGA